MKTLRFYGTLLMAVLFASLVACSESSDSEEEQESPSVPVNPGDYQDVPTTGGVIKKGNIAINFPSGTFDSDTKVAITEVKKGSVGGENEASQFYQLTLPMSTKKPFVVKMKANDSSGEAEFVVRSPGYAVSLVSDVTNEAAAETTSNNGVYTTTIPAFDSSDSKDDVSITIGLRKIPDENAARRITRANNSVIGMDGNITWELDIDYWSEYSLDYKKLKEALPTVNMYIKEAVKTIHDLGFKIPEGAKLNYHLADTEYLFGLISSYGYYSRSLIGRSFDGIYLKDALVLKNNTSMLKQTIIHETLHNFQSYYDAHYLVKPIGDHMSMYEIGAVWIEKYMNNGELNGKWQMFEQGLFKTIKNNFRTGLSQSSSDVKSIYGSYEQQGYALAPLLYYMVSKNYSRGYNDTSVESLYSSYWGRINVSGATLFDVLNEWYSTTFKEQFFNGTDNINNYYLDLWQGKVMSGFVITNIEDAFDEYNKDLLAIPKLKINKLDEKNTSFNLKGEVYPYGSEGLAIKMEENGFKDSQLNDQEMVIKQEAEGLKTYLLYNNGTSNVTLCSKAAQKGDSICISGTELEALRKKNKYGTIFFLLTVRTNSTLTDTGSIPSKESVELRKASSTLKMTDVTELEFSVSVKALDSYNGNESSVSNSVSLSSFDDYEITQKGTTVHLVFTRSKDEAYNSNGGQYIVERELAFDIVDFSKEALNLDKYGPGQNGLATSKIENLTYFSYTKAVYPNDSHSEYKITELQCGIPTMYHIPSEASSLGRYHFICEGGAWKSEYWTLNAFSYKETYKDPGKSAKEHNYTLTDNRDDLIYLKLKYDYTTEKK